MDVRLARPTDAPLVLSLTLDEGAHLVKSPDWPAARPLSRALARSLLALAYPGRTWIARDGKQAALLEARPRRYVIGWDITRLAVQGDLSSMLPPVVEAATRHLYAHGVPRLFARCEEDAAGELEPLGFHALAREYVLLGTSHPIDPEPLPGDSRYRMPQDAWPLHKLESDITPPLVRQLEGLTSLEWSQRSKGVTEIVVEQDGRLVGWIGWHGSRLSDVRQLGLLIHPEHCDLAVPLLTHVLAQVPAGTQFVARLRDYQPEAVAALLDVGFTIVAEEILMVRHGRVVLAPAERSLLRVARVPGVGVFSLQLLPNPALHPHLRKEELS